MTHRLTNADRRIGRRHEHATIGLSWWLGLALAPTAGTQLLSVSPSATMLTAAQWR
jgi:hypothetical protein